MVPGNGSTTQRCAIALDTKYRPTKYSDVLGQDSATAVLRQYVKEGKGFHQSYVFCGQHGSGKTTLGRILARALLCESPVDGEPCDKCESCTTLLTGGSHASFEELDAASKSKKEDLARIVEDVSYSSFSGRRRIYLFDEAHRLSKQALDVLLKPMEDSVSGSEEKQLVVIFCTTEPEKMTSTIFSRCAPAFVIRTVTAEIIANRLLSICDQEGITAEVEALVTIAELAECHIRDALKTVEGVSMLGPITRASVFEYLHLGVNDFVVELLLALGEDLHKAVELSTSTAVSLSPSALYERLSEAAMSAYRSHLGIGSVSSQWNSEKMKTLSSRGPALLEIAARFAAPPHRPTKHTLLLDVGSVHQRLVVGPSQELCPTLDQALIRVPAAPQAQEAAKKIPVVSAGYASQGILPSNATTPHTSGGVWIDPRAIGRGSAPPPTDSTRDESLSVVVFRDLVNHHLKGLKRGSSGRAG